MCSKIIMKSTTIVMFVITLVRANHHLLHHHKYFHHFHLGDVLNTTENFFSNTNRDIQALMNQLFELMNLREQFPHEPKIKILLTMFYDLNNIVENTFEVYDILRNATAVEYDKKTIKQIKLEKTIREILTEKQFNMYDNSKLSNDKHIIETIPSTKPSMSAFKDSQEFKHFIKGFISKVKSLTVEDLLRKKSPAKPHYSARRNLKLWEPSLSMETDYYHNNNDTRSRRLFRGKRTNIWKFPFIASIHIMDEFACAGSIISTDLIITAASCLQVHHNNRFFRENPKTTYVRIGSDWTLRRGDLIPVLELYFYPSYDPRTLKHNLAILRLERLIRFEPRRRPKVRRIRLDDGFGNMPVNTDDIKILGWGAQGPNQVVENHQKLSVAVIDVFPVNECRLIYSKEYVSDTNFCAGFLSHGGGACNRDVGGPGVVDDTLIGVVSFGSPVCGAPNSPTVFTRVGPYIDWIERILEIEPVRYGARTTTKRPLRKSPVYFDIIWTTKTYPRIAPILTSSLLPYEEVLQTNLEPAISVTPTTELTTANPEETDVTEGTETTGQWYAPTTTNETETTQPEELTLRKLIYDMDHDTDSKLPDMFQDEYDDIPKVVESMKKQSLHMKKPLFRGRYNVRNISAQHSMYRTTGVYDKPLQHHPTAKATQKHITEKPMNNENEAKTVFDHQNVENKEAINNTEEYKEKAVNQYLDMRVTQKNETDIKHNVNKIQGHVKKEDLTSKFLTGMGIE